MCITTQQLENDNRVWTREELEAEFDVLGASGTTVIVMRRLDSRLGSVQCDGGDPPHYFGWTPDMMPR